MPGLSGVYAPELDNCFYPQTKKTTVILIPKNASEGFISQLCHRQLMFCAKFPVGY